jgi:hypothetical protein
MMTKREKSRKEQIRCKIVMGTQYVTRLQADTIEELLEKIKEYHTMDSFSRRVYEDKGTLEEEMNSGWYLKETDEN